MIHTAPSLSSSGLSNPSPLNDTSIKTSNKSIIDYQFFIDYTYTAECALLGYNFTKSLEDIGIFNYFAHIPDHRIIAVQLLYLFYKYQVHHNDMAIDLALTIHYIEDAIERNIIHKLKLNDIYNFITFSVFLAHIWNQDRTIKLSDWYKELAWQKFNSQYELNKYIFYLFKDFRAYKLRGSTSQIKSWVIKLCQTPALGHYADVPSSGAVTTDTLNHKKEIINQCITSSTRASDL